MAQPFVGSVHRTRKMFYIYLPAFQNSIYVCSHVCMYVCVYVYVWVGSMPKSPEESIGSPGARVVAP